MEPVSRQSFIRRLDILCYFLVWIGALALLPVPQGAPPLVLAFCLVIAPSFFLNLPAGRSAVYRTVWRLITVAFIVGSLVDWHLNGRPLRQTLVAQMCFFQTYKAYNNKNYSDYLQMVLFATLMIVFCGLVSDSVFFVAILVPFVAILVAFLQKLTLCKQYLVASDGTSLFCRRKQKIAHDRRRFAPDRPRPEHLATPRISWALQTLSILAIGLVLFYILPRQRAFSPSYFPSSERGSGQDPVFSGLAAGVNLAHFRNIRKDPRPVLKVTFPAKVPPPDAVYMRSGALERLADFEWYALSRQPGIAEPDSDGIFWFEPVAPSDRPKLIPHVVEFLDRPRQMPIALPGLVALKPLKTRLPDFRLGVVGRLTSLWSYLAFSWGVEKGLRTPAALEPKPVWEESLALPDELKTLKIHILASKITHGCTDNLTRAEAIEHYLRRRYGYSLNLEPLNGPAGGPNPIERFLFDYRRGSCEIFASAMVVLCRDLGIPSRLAIGYHGGIRGESPNEFIFRNQDAHTWVEVWSARKGWVTFDPTPPPPLEVYTGRFSFKKMLEWFNLAKTRWNQMIVWYDNESKARWMTYLWEPLERWALETRIDNLAEPDLLRRIRDNIARPGFAGLLTALLFFNTLALVLYIKARRFWRHRRARGARRARALDPWTKFYRSAVAAMKGKIAKRDPSQTPGEFLLSLARARSVDRATARRIADLYYVGRFGGAPWDREVAYEARRLLALLRGERSDNQNFSAQRGRAETER